MLVQKMSNQAMVTQIVWEYPHQLGCQTLALQDPATDLTNLSGASGCSSPNQTFYPTTLSYSIYRPWKQFSNFSPLLHKSSRVVIKDEPVSKLLFVWKGAPLSVSVTLMRVKGRVPFMESQFPTYSK